MSCCNNNQKCCGGITSCIGCNDCCTPSDAMKYIDPIGQGEDETYSISTIVNANNCDDIKTYFENNRGDLNSLLIFYGKIMKAEKYGLVQAHIGWNGLDKLVCSDLCNFRVLLKLKGWFWKTMNTAIQFYLWEQKNKKYKERGLSYCCPFTCDNTQFSSQG